MSKNQIIEITNQIYIVRDQKVMLDIDTRPNFMP